MAAQVMALRRLMSQVLSVDEWIPLAAWTPHQCINARRHRLKPRRSISE